MTAEAHYNQPLLDYYAAATTSCDGLNGKLEVTDIDFDVPENMHYIITYMAE